MKKILIITHQSIQYGLGHFSRSINIKEALKMNYSVNIYNYKNPHKFIKPKKFYDDLLRYDLLIVDLPKALILSSKLIFLSQKILFIDFVIKKKNFYSILSSLKKKNTKQIKSGFNFIPLSIEINNVNQISKKLIKNNEIIIFSGSSSEIPRKIILFCKKNLKKFKFKIISKRKNKNINILKTIKLFSKKEFLKKLKFSYGVLMRFGITTYEAIALGLKPIIWIFNENEDRLKEIFFLKKKNLITVFNENNFNKYLLQKNKVKKINYSNILNFIKKILKS